MQAQINNSVLKFFLTEGYPIEIRDIITKIWLISHSIKNIELELQRVNENEKRELYFAANSNSYENIESVKRRYTVIRDNIMNTYNHQLDRYNKLWRELEGVLDEISPKYARKLKISWEVFYEDIMKLIQQTVKVG